MGAITTLIPGHVVVSANCLFVPRDDCQDYSKIEMDTGDEGVSKHLQWLQENRDLLGVNPGDQGRISPSMEYFNCLIITITT